MILVDLKSMRKLVIITLCIIFFAGLFTMGYTRLHTETSATLDEVKYKDYTGLDGKISYKLPLEWETSEKDFDGEEILYHNDFTSRDKALRGYVQIWNLNMPLIEFIKRGRESGIGITTYKYYIIEDVKINGSDGYILSYSKAKDNNKYTKAFEVFVLDKANIFYRFAFYMDESKWKDGYRMYFLNIAASAKIKN